MRFAHVQTSPVDFEFALERARHANLLMGHVSQYAEAMRQENPTILLFDYLRPTVNTPWTQYVQGLGGGSIPRGCEELLDQGDLDGILLDTVFETDDPWGMVRLVDDIASAISPLHLCVNFGDRETWLGRTSVSKALAAITDWHQVEVWMDINHLDLGAFARAAAGVTRGLRDQKQMILGVYDEGRKKPELARSVMQQNNNQVYWSYKTSPLQYEFYPEDTP